MCPATPPERSPLAVDALFLAAPRISTFLGTQALTNASGLFFERDGQLFVVTSRHVVIDEEGRLEDVQINVSPEESVERAVGRLEIGD